MANPFDDALNKDKANMTKETEQRKEGQRKDKDELRVSFSINKRMLERALFIIIIIGLAILVVANPFCESNIFNRCSNEAVPKSDLLEEEKTQTTEEVDASKETVEEKETAEEEETVEEEETAEEEVEKLFKGNFDFTFEDIDYEENDDGDPSKMNSITISIINSWKEFNPRMEVYWYDISADNSIKDMVRLNKVLGRVKTGRKYTFTLREPEFSSRFFLFESQETIKIKLYNNDNDLLMDTYTTTIS